MIVCGDEVNEPMKNIGKMVKTTITEENELASLAVGETAPIVIHSAVKRKYDAISSKRYFISMNGFNWNEISKGMAPFVMA